jgi:hypothetical protein
LQPETKQDENIKVHFFIHAMPRFELPTYKTPDKGSTDFPQKYLPFLTNFRCENFCQQVLQSISFRWTVLLDTFVWSGSALSSSFQRINWYLNLSKGSICVCTLQLKKVLLSSNGFINMEKNAILPKSLPSYPFCKFLQGNPSKLK